MGNYAQELYEHTWEVGLGTSELPQDLEQTSILAHGGDEPYAERMLRMLRHVDRACLGCSMCELGLRPARRDAEVRDPHVFSNMRPSRFMIVGQGPGWNEVVSREPFIGAAGHNLDVELAANGLSRDQFYISNAVRCFITDNAKPTDRHIARCKPFLEIEINLLKPHFIITLGAVPFQVFCPHLIYSTSLGELHHSVAFDVMVFAVYHPSPLNLSNAERRAAFARQIRLISAVVKRKMDYSGGGSTIAGS